MPAEPEPARPPLNEDERRELARLLAEGARRVLEQRRAATQADKSPASSRSEGS